MITQETLSILLKDDTIKEIVGLCEDIGLSNLRLFLTHEFEDRNQIHFLGKSTQPGIDLFLIQHAQREIATLLNCEVVVRAEHMLHELVKEEVLSNTTAYTATNKENIKHYFEKNILPFAQMRAEEFFKHEKSEESSRSDTPHEILDRLQKDPALWEKIQRNPQTLQQAVDLFSQSQQQMLTTQP